MAYQCTTKPATYKTLPEHKISLQALSIDLLGEIIKIYIEKTKITLLQCSLESRASESIIPIR